MTLVSVAACGGAADSGLFGGGSTFATADAGGPTTQPPGSDATAPPMTGGDSSVPPTLLDAQPPPIVGQDADALDSAIPPPVDPGVRCGNAFCNVPSEVCCRTTVLGAATFACTAVGGCFKQDEALAIPCDDALNCATAGHPNLVCCADGTVDQTSQTLIVTNVMCRSMGACAGDTRKIVCDPTSANACPAATTCISSTTVLPGYDLCE